MVLGLLGGVVIGCLIAMLNAKFWHSVGPTKELIARINVYVGTPLIVIIAAVVGAITGAQAGW